MKTFKYLMLAYSITLVGINSAYAEKRKVVISQLFQSIQLLPVYIAMDQGFFANQSLDVSKQTAGSANGALSALLSGSADFSLHGPEWSAIAAEKGAPVQVIASVVNRPSFWLAARPEAPFNTIDDLKGETVASGLMPTTSTSLFIKKLTTNGLIPSRDVTISQVAIGSELGPLLANQAQYAVLYEPGLDQAVANGMKVAYSFSTMFDAYTVAAISSKKDIDPQLAERFVAGLQQALVYMQHDETGTIAVAQREFPGLDANVVASAVQRMLKEGVYSASVDISVDAFKNAMQTQVDLGNLKTLPNYQELVNRQYIESAVKGSAAVK